MIRSRLYAIGLLLSSVTAMVGLGIWNFTQARVHALGNHELWAGRVTARVLAERLSSSRWLDELAGMSRQEIKRELLAQPDFAGAYWFDVRTHEYERWAAPFFPDILDSPDPRLVVTQLKATQMQSTLLGPMLRFHGALFQTVAEPLDGRHAMVVILSAPEIKRILEEEAEWAHLQVFVYDTERHPLFIGGELPAIQAAVSETLVRSQAGAPSGPVPLKPRQAWHGVATYHPAPSLDGVFII